MKGKFLKMASFFDFFQTGHFLPVCFGTRLDLLSSAQRGIKTKGYQMVCFLSFENLTFWYPFVLVPVWVPPRTPHRGKHLENVEGLNTSDCSIEWISDEMSPNSGTSQASSLAKEGTEKVQKAKELPGK